MSGQFTVARGKNLSPPFPGFCISEIREKGREIACHKYDELRNVPLQTKKGVVDKSTNVSVSAAASPPLRWAGGTNFSGGTRSVVIPSGIDYADVPPESFLERLPRKSASFLRGKLRWFGRWYGCFRKKRFSVCPNHPVLCKISSQSEEKSRDEKMIVP